MNLHSPHTGRYLITTLTLVMLWLLLPGFTGSSEGNACVDGLCKGGGEDNAELMQRVQRYLTYYHSYSPAAEHEVLFIVPYEGCPYCVEKVINFYINLQKDSQMALSDLILSGSGQEAAMAAPHFADIQDHLRHFDNKNMLKRYGIGSTYPIAVYFENGEVAKVSTINTQSLENVQSDILTYLGS